MMPGRARLHRLTRDAGFLWRACAAIVAAGIVFSAVMQSLRPEDHRPRRNPVISYSKEWRLRMKSHASEFLQHTKPRPAELASWLNALGRGMKHEAPEWKFDPVSWRIDDIDLVPILEKNTEGESQRRLFSDYVQGLFLGKGEARDQILRRIHETALREPAVPFAGGFDGDLWMIAQKPREALASYLREGEFPEARDARREAFAIAIRLEDADTLRRLCANPRYLAEVGSLAMTRAARITGDWWLLLRLVAHEQWRRWSHSLVLPLALLAAGVWYVLLVYTGSSGRMPAGKTAADSAQNHSASDPWRWIRFLPPVLAGVMSVWLLDFWMEAAPYGLNDHDQKTMTHEIIQWVMYVGIPEESVKLALFTLFLPILLRQRSSSRAALTAGCVGLGFAFNENLGYYLSDGGAAAIGRFITANFLHVAWTGIAGTALYDLFRSRFHRAGEFLATFLGVAAAHGIYDFAITASAQTLGIDFAGIIILAIMAKIYLDLLRPDDGELKRRTISATAVFCIGCALLVSATIIVTVWQMNSMSGATAALRSIVSVFPVALIYVREFREL